MYIDIYVFVSCLSQAAWAEPATDSQVVCVAGPGRHDVTGSPTCRVVLLRLRRRDNGVTGEAPQALPLSSILFWQVVVTAHVPLTPTCASAVPTPDDRYQGICRDLVLSTSMDPSAPAWLRIALLLPSHGGSYLFRVHTVSGARQVQSLNTIVDACLVLSPSIARSVAQAVWCAAAWDPTGNVLILGDVWGRLVLLQPVFAAPVAEVLDLCA